MNENSNNVLFTFEDLPLFSMYIGVNHLVRMFHPSQFYVSRKDDRVLLDPEAETQPYFTLYPGTPLSIRPVSTEPKDVLCLPSGCYEHVEIPGNWWQYDCIIVSRLYSSTVLSLGDRVRLEFVDRLYNLVPLWDKDPQRSNDAHLSGAAGLRKATTPLPPAEYVKRLPKFNPCISSDQIPSLAAMALSAELYSQDPYAGEMASHVAYQIALRSAEAAKRNGQAANQ